MITAKSVRIVGFAAGAAAIAGAAIFVTASAAGLTFGATPAAKAASSTTAGNGACDEFVSHFSSDLGKSQSDVNAAFQKAIGETLADEVKAGKLTQAEADAIKSRMAGKAPCALAGTLRAPKSAAGGEVYHQALLTAAAAALGVSSDTLKADLAKGMTLHQIADAQNPPVTEDQFRSRLIAQLKPTLDKAVTDKKITSAQEQKILTGLQSGPIPFWDKPRKAAA